jgi:hypothetical protein
MGWWKCSNSLYFTDVVSSLSKSNGRYAAGKTIRPFVFIRILDYSAENVVLMSHEHLSNMTSQQIGQCQIVWDTCIKHNVLRKDGNGYSAREWMQEQGLLPDSEVISNPIETVQPETPKQKRQYEIKEQVRPNVRLSRKETEELKKDYSDEQIARMLDKLSEYKTNTGRNYQSDYQAIRKWVYKTLDEKPKKIAGHTELVDFPDWIFGINGESNDEG